PAKDVTDLTAALKKAGTRHAIETLPGTQHGFCFAERAVYNPVAAEHTWEKIFDLWDRNLKKN
ncbi:MAG: dienelactone hydrolase family protein, partial [Betaproteobacteria bacterium]|nr:dienelactone hydrolase family protein [Betaproteobacteria bacterium]